MKKVFILLTLTFGIQTSFGQLTQANEPSAGTYAMYVVDTAFAMPSVSGLATVSGTSAVWDYSGITITTNTKDVVVADVSGVANFPDATKTMDQGTFLQYFHSSATERVSDGYVYDAGVPIGVVDILFDVDPATVVTYPFAYNSSLTDNFAGSAITDLGTFDLSGKINSTIDGTGTLVLPGEQIENVFRLKIIDTVDATGVPLIGSIQLIRTQFEYYDLATQDMPIFIDAFVQVPGVNEERQILSTSYSTIGLDAVAIPNFVIYPNPTTDNFVVNGDFTKGNVEVVDLAGRVVYTGGVNAGATVTLNDVKSGVYTVRVNADGKTAIQKLTIK